METFGALALFPKSSKFRQLLTFRCCLFFVSVQTDTEVGDEASGTDAVASAARMMLLMKDAGMYKEYVDDGVRCGCTFANRLCETAHFVC